MWKICEFGLSYCNLATMVKNIGVILRVLTLNVDSRYDKGIPLCFYLLTYTTGACFFYVYLINLCWFVFVRCPQTGDLLAATVVLSLGISSNIGTVKLLNMIVFNGEIKQLTQEYLECEAQTIPGSRYEANLLKMLRIVKKRAIAYWLVIILNGVLYLLKPILYPGRNLPENLLVIYGLEPMFDSPNYEVAVVTMSAGVIFGTYAPASVTAWLIIIAGYTESQLRALSKEMRNIWPDAVEKAVSELRGYNTDEYDSIEVINKHVENILKDLIKRHAVTVRLFRNLQDLFTVAIAMGFFLLIFGLIMELLGKLENTYLQMPFAIMQVSMDCFIGQQVMDACLMFEASVYDCRWENFNKNNMKLVLVMLQSSQKTMTLSAGGMATLSYKCLMSIMRGIYSTYTALRSTTNL